MIPTLALLLALQSPTDTVVGHVRGVLKAFSDTSAARAAGYAPLGAGRLQDGTPFQGIHWVSLRRFLANTEDLDHPPFLMYSPGARGLELVGAAYSRRIGHDEPSPRTLAGTETDWHLHQACFSIPGVGFALADGVEDCHIRGGFAAPRQTAMVHVWLEENPDGPYGHDNILLPFKATGIQPPAPYDDHRLRALGVALGESFGHRPPYAKRLLAGLKAKGALPPETAHRELTQLVDQLRACQVQRNDCEATIRQLLTKEEELQALYSRLAPNDAFREQMERQYSVMLGEEHHH